MPRKKAYVETYGCQMNISDGELMSGVLASQGYDLVETPDQADVVLVNTCAIRQHAEQRVLGRVAQLNGLKDKNPELLIGVTGCMAQRMGEELLRKAPFVDLVMGPDGYRSLPEALQSVRSSGPRLAQGLTVLSLDPAENYEGLELRRTSSVSAWVPIQRGCDHRCTFCIVPFVRGPEKNRDPQAVLDEIRDVAEKGITEVTLLGQTVNSYRAGEWDFPRLLQAVARIPGIRRVRFTSPHPNDVTPELVQVMAREDAVCEQLHLPLQAGNDRTLKRMLRRHVRFDDAFTYRFSPRDGTPATRFPPEDLIPEDEGRARLDELIQLTRGIQREINEGEVGRLEEVLVEKEGKEAGFLLGRTRRNKAAVFLGEKAQLGSYQILELTRTTGATFVGIRVDPAAVAESK
jgi:tRNA-2-methylthio-N6-dimethylallyladenosine synthase